jgi:hypothetical protein
VHSATPACLALPAWATSTLRRARRDLQPPLAAPVSSGHALLAGDGPGTHFMREEEGREEGEKYTWMQAI